MPDASLEHTVARLLTQRHQSLSLAESCTGGCLAHRLTALPGSSAFFAVGLVTYADAAKTLWLNVPADLIQRCGAVSEEVAEQMATHVRERQKTDWGIGITGIAGPDGGSQRKPVGLVYIAVAGRDECLTAKCQFTGDRQRIQQDAATAALTLLLEFLDP